MKKLFRIVAQSGLDRIKESGKIKTSTTKWEPYSENQVVLLFEGDNVNTLFEKFSKTISEQRDLDEGDPIYVLEIINPPGKLESDQSAKYWPESKAHFGDIPNSCVLIIGESKVIVSRSGYCEIDELVVYDEPKLIRD